MRDVTAQALKDAGFATRTYDNAVFAYLKTRNVDTNEVATALGAMSDLLRFRPAADPHRYNRTGVLIRF